MGNNITDIIRQIVEPSLPSIAVGNVIETNPLTVILANDADIVLSAQSLIVASDKLPLEIGESLYLLVLNRNKIYYVLDRVCGIWMKMKLSLTRLKMMRTN